MSWRQRLLRRAPFTSLSLSRMSTHERVLEDRRLRLDDPPRIEGGDAVEGKPLQEDPPWPEHPCHLTVELDRIESRDPFRRWRRRFEGDGVVGACGGPGHEVAAIVEVELHPLVPGQPVVVGIESPEREFHDFGGVLHHVQPTDRMEEERTEGLAGAEADAQAVLGAAASGIEEAGQVARDRLRGNPLLLDDSPAEVSRSDPEAGLILEGEGRRERSLEDLVERRLRTSRGPGSLSGDLQAAAVTVMQDRGGGEVLGGDQEENGRSEPQQGQRNDAPSGLGLQSPSRLFGEFHEPRVGGPGRPPQLESDGQGHRRRSQRNGGEGAVEPEVR